MIEHIKILSLVIFLILGTFVIFRIAQAYKIFGYAYLFALLKHTITINIAFLVLLIGLYAHENLQEDFYTELASKYRYIIDLIICLIVIGLIYFMAEVVFAFRNISIHKVVKKIVLILVLILIISYLFRIIFPILSVYFSWLDFLRYQIFENLIILEFLILLFSLFNWQNRIPKDLLRITRSFSAFYLIRYFLSMIFAYLFSRYEIIESYRFVIGFSILLIYNLFPLLWLYYFFEEYATNKLIQKRPNIELETILSDYNISKREIEVIKLILQGKSNEDIKNELFISFHTVKNHISNIFKKLNVKSRYELIYFLTKILD